MREKVVLIQRVGVTGLHLSIDPLFARHDPHQPQRFPIPIIPAIPHPHIPPRNLYYRRRVDFPRTFTTSPRADDEVLQALHQ